MSSAPPRRVKSVEELAIEENEGLRALHEWEQERPPHKIERRILLRVLLISILFALFTYGVVSLANPLSLQSSILLFLAVFVIFVVLFVTALTLGTGGRPYINGKKKGV